MFVQGDLVVLALVQDHFVGTGLGGGHVALGVNGSGVLLQNIVIAQAQSAINGFHQFGIRCHTTGLFFYICCLAGCCFIGICLVQGRESIRHILVDGIEPIYHILVDLLNHLVLGLVRTDPGCGFAGQGGVQFGHIVANGVGRFHDGPILYGGIGLAHIIVPSFIQYIVLNGSNAVIQGLIAGFAGSFLGINIGLELLICIVSFRLAVHVSRICLISQLGVCFRLAVHISRICLIGQLGVCFRLAVYISRICLIGQLGICFHLAVHVSRIYLIS